MKQNFKKIFTSWRVLLLVFLIVYFLFFQIYSPSHLPFTDAQGVVIRNVLADSAASLGGMTAPDGHLKPLQRERILAINAFDIKTEEDYFNAVSELVENQTVRVETDRATYTLLTTEPGTIGVTISDAPTSNVRKGLDLEGGTRVLLKPSETISQEDLDSTIASLQQRLNVFGLSDVIVRAASDLSGEQFILVELAGVTEDEVRSVLASQGKFEAKIANQTVFSGGDKDVTYVCRSAECSGIDPRSGCGQTGDGYACGFFFSISVSPEAAQRQADATDKLQIINDRGNRYLSDDIVLFLDDVEVDRLRIGAELKGRATSDIQISGSGVGRTQEEAVSNALANMNQLQTVIITGSLPVKLDVVKMDTISPTLGNEFLNNVLFVGLLVVVAVSVVVFARYRKAKVAVPMVLTLLSELVLILGFAALVGWNLDLAGIAGILIVVGTGVDHLIVITDETVRGEEESSWKQRIKNAMFIVVGAYLTTLSGMLPLLWAGAGLLKGFALTTIAGISFGVLIARPAYARVIEILME